MDTSQSDQDYIGQNIGKFGKFQIKCFLVVQFVGVFAAWQGLGVRIPSLLSRGNRAA